MSSCRNPVIIVTVLLVLLSMVLGCGEPSGGTSAADFSKQIAKLDPADPDTLGKLIEISEDLDAAVNAGTISEKQKERLTRDLGKKFNKWVKARVDELDPEDPDFIGKLVNLTGLQETDLPEKFGYSKETHEYKEKQIKDKFNEWIRREADRLDPSDPEFLEKLVNLTLLQETDLPKKFGYTEETHKYKEKQIKEKFNQWMESEIGKLDTSQDDFLKKFEELIVVTREYAKWYSEENRERLKEKYSQWLKRKVDELDPTRPDFLAKYKELLRLQETSEYSKWCSKETHEYKEMHLRYKYKQWEKLLLPPQEPVYTIPTGELDISWQANCSWSSEGATATLTINFTARDLTNGKSPVTRVTIEVDGKVAHDSGTISVANYSHSVTLVVSKGSHLVKAWARNARGNTVEASKSITCGQ